MPKNTIHSIDFLIDLTIQGEATDAQFEDLMKQVENDNEVKERFTQAVVQHEYLSTEIPEADMVRELRIADQQKQLHAEELTREEPSEEQRLEIDFDWDNDL